MGQSQIREQGSNTLREPKLEMRVGPSCTILLHLLVCANSKPQTLFDGLSRAFGKVIQEVVQPKPAGSVNTRLGLLANDLGLDPTADSASSSSQQSSAFTAGTNSGNNLSGRQQQQCCCEPLGSQCDVGGQDLVGSGLIDARKKPSTTKKPSIATRIVNRPSTSEPQQSCPVGQTTCCYDANIDLSVFGKTCLNPQSAQQNVPWTQGCQENQPQGSKQCGTRNYNRPVSGLTHGQASPGEFPWTCLLLNQFDYQFSNGTGVRCYVAGWGKDESDGSFQFIPKKVDLPLVNNNQCEASLKAALNAQKPGAGDRFRLHPSEICAGAEVGKDACTGDGGSPLVCQAQSGRWTVMGLVTWGVGCASDLPGVYARMSHFRNWINAN